MQRIDLCSGWEFYWQNAPKTRRAVRLPHDFSIGTARTPDRLMGSEGGWFQGGAGSMNGPLRFCRPPAIIACGSGNSNAGHCYAGDLCHAWRGRALFILRSGDAPGTVRLRVSA